MSADPDPSELQQAFEALRAAADAFDERLTEMMTVQRRLIRVVRQVDPDALDSLGRQTASELVVELRDLTEQLRRHAQPPAVLGTVPAHPATGDQRLQRLHQREGAAHAKLKDALPELLEERPVDLERLHDLLYGRNVRDFDPLADAIEQLEQDDRFAETPLGAVRVADLLCQFHSVGAQRADRVLEDAELPPDVTLGDLGPADVDRLGRRLRLYQNGFTRVPAKEPRPDPLRGQDPETATYTHPAAGAEVAEAFIFSFRRDVPRIEDLLREQCPAELWPGDGLQAGLLLLEWLRADLLAAVDEEFVVSRPVDSLAAASDLVRHLGPVHDQVHHQARYPADGADDAAVEDGWRRQEIIDRVMAAATHLIGAHELERVDPLCRRQRATPRSKCAQAGRDAALAFLMAALPDGQDDRLVGLLRARLGGAG